MRNFNLEDSIHLYNEFVKGQAQSLRGLEKRFYTKMPDPCWMTENTLAKEFKTSRRQIRKAKESLAKKGLIEISVSPNKRRSNPIHTLHRANPINTISMVSIDSIEEDYIDSLHTEFLETREQMKVNWELLSSKTHKELNEMSKMELVQFYMDCNYIVLPTHHPIFTSQGVACSCKAGLACHSIGKHPVISYKHLNSYTYPKIRTYIKSLFTQNPMYNIGFKVSSFSVLDLDYQRDAKDSFAKLKKDYKTNTLDNVTSVTTPNGVHLYVDNTDLLNNANIVGDGIDVRSEGGFVLAAGSTHKSGKKYEWNTISTLGHIPAEWVTVVDKGVKRIRKEKKNSSSVTLKDILLPKEITPDYKIKVGSRNNTLFKWACRERGKGADADLLFDILTTIRDSCCEDSDSVTDLELRTMSDRVAFMYPTNAQKDEQQGTRRT